MSALYEMPAGPYVSAGEFIGTAQRLVARMEALATERNEAQGERNAAQAALLEVTAERDALQRRLHENASRCCCVPCRCRSADEGTARYGRGVGHE